MSSGQTRVSPQWLGLREPADAQARSARLAGEAARILGDGAGPMVVHDLGSGSGSMGRWLAPLLPGRQHWVLHDRDADLLRMAEAYPPTPAVDGATVTVETRLADLTRLRPDDLAGASLITASALLDMLTADEVDRLVRSCVTADCPALITLTVTGRVRLTPPDALDTVIRQAFNDHQRRTTQGRTLLGPDAARVAVHRFRMLGWRVEARASPWLLEASSRPLLTEWLTGWVHAAREQRPELAAASSAYLARRSAELELGGLAVTVQHVDLLASPPGVGR